MHFFLLILNFKVKIKLTGYLINLKSLSLCKGSGGIIIGMLNNGWRFWKYNWNDEKFRKW